MAAKHPGSHSASVQYETNQWLLWLGFLWMSVQTKTMSTSFRFIIHIILFCFIQCYKLH